MIDELDSLYIKLESQEEKFDSIEDKVEASGYFTRMDFIFNQDLADISPLPDFQKEKAELKTVSAMTNKAIGWMR